MSQSETLTIGVGVLPGNELPEVGTTMYVQSELTDTYYAITPKRIKSLRWGKDGRLIVDMLATRKKVTAAEVETARS